MKMEPIDFVALVCGIGLALLGNYADVTPAVFVGGAWMGAFLFKLGYVCEKHWGGEQ